MHAQTHTHRSRHTCKNIKMNIKTNILMCIHTQLQTHAHRCMSAQAYMHKHVKMSMKTCSCARTHTLHTTQHIHTHTHTHSLHYITLHVLLCFNAGQISLVIAAYIFLISSMTSLSFAIMSAIMCCTPVSTSLRFDTPVGKVVHIQLLIITSAASNMHRNFSSFLIFSRC